MSNSKSFPANNCVQFLYHRHYKEAQGQCSLFLRDRLSQVQRMYNKDLKAHWGCVNAIEFSNNGGEWIISGGDDRRIMLWNMEKAIEGIGSPATMKGQHNSNIFCLSFDNSNKKIFSGGNDEQVVIHDLKTGETENVYLHEDAVYGISVSPDNDSVFASAGDDGRILIYDTREAASSDPFCLANYTSPMHAVVYNPMAPQLLATANSKEGIGLWDVRKPRSCLMRYGGSMSAQSCMSVRISSDGEQLIALRRRLPPVLYKLNCALPQYQFDHSGYYNSCTMKSCCFAGDRDQYLLSGSDDFNLYMWKIPKFTREVPWVGEAHLVLRGHRSIVNQVRFNPTNSLVISSGVEKVIKAWSVFPMPEASDNYDERPVYSHEEYINLVLHSGQVMSHDYSHESVEEDPRMIAFFDSLVQRELEGWSSEGDSLQSDDNFMERLVQSSPSADSSPIHSEDDGEQAPLNLSIIVAPDTTTQQQQEFHHLLDMDVHRSAHHSESSAPPAHEGPTTSATSQASTTATDRRSISELIATKRKDYLSTVNRLTKLEARRAKRKKQKVKHCLERVRLTKPSRCKNGQKSDTSSGSDSTSGSMWSSEDSSTDTDKSSHRDTDLATLFDRNSEETQKRKTSLNVAKRLAALRRRANASDSEDNHDNNMSTTRNSAEAFRQVSTNDEKAKDGLDNNTIKSEYAIVDIRTCMCNGNRNLDKHGNNVKTESEDGQLHSSSCSSVSCSKCNSDSLTTANCSEERMSDRQTVINTAVCNGKTEASVSTTVSEAQGTSGSSSGHTTWKDFKRFRNRVERMRKHFRNHRENSSDEDSD